MEDAKHFILHYWLIIVGSLSGISLALTFIYFGFFRTILILVFGIFGGSLGYSFYNKYPK